MTNLEEVKSVFDKIGQGYEQFQENDKIILALTPRGGWYHCTFEFDLVGNYIECDYGE